MVDVSGSDNTGGPNQSAENNFDASRFWFEWIELDGTSTSNLSEAGFDISNGDLGPGQTVYNAGGFNAVNIPSASGQFGNGGNDFAVRLSTTLTVETGGTYTFNLGSDDGSRLYVDGVEIIENDDLQPITFEDGEVDLAPGQHEIVIIFFERGGQQQLQATISGPDTGGSPIDLANANVGANAGDDRVQSGEGNDTVDGGDGNDSILSGADDDLVNGGDGADEIQGGGGNDTINGGAGNDTILGDGENHAETRTRQSFNWDEIPDPNNGGQIDDGDNLVGGTVQNTGLINVQASFTTLQGDVNFAFDTFTANTDGIDSGGETVATNSSGQLVADDGDESTGRAIFEFSASAPDVEDGVQNLSFRINDIDASSDGDAEDSVRVRAFNEAGEEVVVSLTPGANLTLSDTGGAPGDDTATQTEGQPGSGTTAANSLLVNIAGPITRLEIDFTGTDENGGGVRITDIYFDAVSAAQDATPGDDVIDGGEGDDVIDGGAGNDTIQGAQGNDDLRGGDGADQIRDFSGNTTVDGGAGADFVELTGNAATDVVSGGTGNDTINIFKGDGGTADVTGDDGDDSITVFNGATSTNTVDGGTGDDSIQTGDSFDTLIGGEGDDTLDSGANDDSLSGGEGNDVLRGFTGNDVLDGGAGDDQIDGGEGADTITGGIGSDALSGGAGSDQFIIADSEGGDTIVGGEDPDGSDIDVIRVDTPFRVDYTGDDRATESGVISFLDDDGNVVSTSAFSEIERVVCFAAGTLIRTPKGQRPVENLRVGDEVTTLDHGPQRVLWINSRRLQRHQLSARPKLRPIRIAAGALGPLMPSEDLVVSPQHRILLRSKIAIRMFDAAEVLVPAQKLLPLDGVEVADDLASVTYFHFKCAEHELIEASGAYAETLHMGPEAMKSMTPDALEELKAIFGEEVFEAPRMARLVPRGAQIRRLVQRHQKNNRPVCSHEV